MNRLFVALWPPSTIQRELTQLSQSLAGLGRVVPPERLHMTLAFIGDFSESAEPVLIERLGSIRSPAFTMTLNRWGQFNRSRALWVGPASTPPALLDLRAEVVNTLETLGHQLESDFTPHVTLARRVKEVTDHQPPLALRWPVESFALVRSHLTDQGPEYQTLARFGLIG